MTDRELNERTIPLTQGYSAVVDEKEYDRLIAFKWRVIKKKRPNGTMQVYACRTTPRPNRRLVMMHREILSVHVGFIVDHIDMDGLNNVASNLRVATMSQNSMHQKKREVVCGKMASSKFKGVHRVTRDSLWVARIWANGKRIHLGCFKSEVEAARAYNSAALKWHKEFAVVNEAE